MCREKPRKVSVEKMPALAWERPMIGGTRSALLAASLLVAAPAVAAQPDGGQYVWVPAGAAVVLMPAAPATPVDFPVARMIAQQQAMMDRMFADMDSLLVTAMPDPARMLRSVMQGAPQMMPGSGVVVTSISTGSGTCSQTITYGYPGNGGQPTVKVSSTGNACSALGAPGPIGVTQVEPAPRPVIPAPAAPRQNRLWTIGYPPHPVTAGTPPHT
jgi:hypothetical protein